MRIVFWWHVIQHRNKVTEDLPMCTSVLTRSPKHGQPQKQTLETSTRDRRHMGRGCEREKGHWVSSEGDGCSRIDYDGGCTCLNAENIYPKKIEFRFWGCSLVGMCQFNMHRPLDSVLSMTKTEHNGSSLSSHHSWGGGGGGRIRAEDQRLERWLSVEVRLVLLQRTWVVVPPCAWWVRAVYNFSSRELGSLSDACGLLYAHGAQILGIMHTHFKNILLNFKIILE